ncbi:MAG: DNA double-strand break repair nuclease NurA [Lagierella massiliensis]|nr:DNA double-strand break repair nuclease NurA [Lagierella massiliensis]
MNDEIVKKLKNLNNELNRKYFLLDSLSISEKRKILLELGNFSHIIPMDKKELQELEKLGGVYAVDGSTNRFGGAFPHYIQIFQGIAIKDLTYKKESVEIYCPILEETDIYEEKNIVERLLAKVELDVAIKALDENPKMIIMDGSLIRYRIICPNTWENFIDILLEKQVIVVGVIEDIKTNLIFENIKKDYDMDFFYDREFLFNCLEYGECFTPLITDRGKNNYGIVSSFFRTSTDPTVIAVDMLEDQKENREFIHELILSITARKSRGIPYILDLVDMKARITNKNIKSLCESYISKDKFELLFHSQRDKRGM